ncbi:MAG: Hsp33 family molecular chaperone HslO [Chloroflexi bacterium]|nr:MAG: Hsp33 family molecular chaperone HslO [Chloroflexota bacterium]
MNNENHSDIMVRVLAKEAGVRGLACLTTGLVTEAQRRQQASPAATVALGYGLTAAALLGAQLKVQQRVALKVDANGPLQKLVAEGDSYGRVRGYVAVPDVVASNPMDTAQTLGNLGLLTVVKDLRLKELYEGVVPLQTGYLDSDLMYYLHHSEQVTALVEIGVKLNPEGELVAAGGLLLDALPSQDLTTLRDLAERLDDMAPLAELFAAGETPATVLAQLFAGVPYEVLEEHPLRFECGCSWERSEQALITLGRAELEHLIAEGQAVVDCHFCGERYVFGREALETILDKLER